MPGTSSAKTSKQIDRLIGAMSLRDKVGQCLTMNFTGYEITAYERRFVEEFRCGGLRVTPHITGMNDDYTIRKLAPYLTPGQYASRIRILQELALERNGIPLHIVTDQEGDLSIDILRGGMSLFPSNMGMTASNAPALVEKAFLVIARQLRAQGIGMIHSPELDVNVNPLNPEIGMRAFSDDPELCAKFGIAALKGLRAGGIIATGKHFPGRGDSEIDAHDDLDVLRVDRKRLDDVELLPYRRLIAAGLPAIMTAHNAYPALDPTLTPASVSYPITTGLLRQELGFDGVITTDAIGMKGLLKFTGGQPAATVMAIKAGADLVLVKADEATTAGCFQALLAAVKNGEIAESRLDQSVQRILRMKAEAGILAKPLSDPAKADAIVCNPENAKVCRKVFAQGAIVTRDRAKLLPLKKDTEVLVVEQHIPLYHEKCNDIHYHSGMFMEWMGRYTKNIVRVETGSPASEEDIARFRARLQSATVVAFFNIFWRGSASNRPLIREAIAAGKQVIVATNDLYDSYFLPTAGTVLCTFGAVPEGSRIAADIIFGKAKSRGKWPLRRVTQDQTVDSSKAVDHKIAGHFSEEQSGKPGKK
jgi:beta-N-acetylhexosaminidase